MKTFFRIAALFDWIVGLGLIFDPGFIFRVLQLDPPNYPGIFLMFGSIVMVWGWVFWQVASNPFNRPLFQVALLAKIIGFLSLSIALYVYQMSPILYLVAIVGDGLWIPPFLYFYKKSR